MDKRFLDFNGVTGENFYTDGDSVVIETVQDVEPVLERNNQLRNNGRNNKAAGFIGASVPLVLHLQWAKEFKAMTGNELNQVPWEEALKFLRSKINSRDFSKVRTSDMKI